MAPKTAHLAPDFDQRVHFNTMRVKPEYRIALKLGNIEDLFANEADKLEGQMERLQVLGLFYFPLGHKKAKDRFPAAWTWFKEKLLGTKDDAVANKAVQDALKSRIVSGAKPPGWNDAPSGLPADAKDPMNPAPENFAKIRFPGCYTVQHGAGAGAVNRDDAYPAKFSDHRQFQHEWTFYKDNKALGKIPLVAFVEKRLSEDDPWQPAKDVSVHFQLLPTYPSDKPAYDSGAKSSEQFAAPPVGALRAVPFSDPMPFPDPTPVPADYPLSSEAGGPKKMIDAEVAHNPTGDASITGADRFKPENADKVDPQGTNADKSRGGKRGNGSLADCSDVAGVVFSTTETEGFNKEGKRKLGHKPYPVAEAAKPDGHKHVHAVRAKTNEDGEAGVIFTPSTCGGDRYRIRAYVGPPTSVSHGAEVGATEVTTGTFVVWRNMRVSRIVKQDVSATPHKKLEADFTPAPHNLTADTYLGNAGAHDGVSFRGMGTVRLDDPDGGNGIFSSVPLHFARGFLELEYDQAPETLGADEFKKAREQALADAKSGQAGRGLGYLDLDVLYFSDVDFPPNDAVAAVVMRSPQSYNALVSPAKQLTLPLSADDRRAVKLLTEDYGLNGFFRVLTKDGALPGITLIYSPMGFTWQLLLGLDYSGRVQDYRGSFLWYGDQVYTDNLWLNGNGFPYDCSCNTCHELGHAMFQPHGVAGDAGVPNAARHDPETDSMCVMSYGKSDGNYCGLTLLAFRGWNVPQPPA
jgi:hypothetical protein